LSVNRWWQGLEDEVYWLELTDREDLGSDLRAPQADDTGTTNWRYSLFREVRPGEIVFHYHKADHAILASSVIAGPPYDHEIVWGARGTSARGRGTVPHSRPGYRVPLADFRRLETPVTASEIEAAKPHLKEITMELSAQHGSIYFPFELSDKRPSRPLQGYAFKLPSAFVAYFPALADGASCGPTPDRSEYEKRARTISRRWRARGLPEVPPAGQAAPRRSQTASGFHFSRDPSVKAWVLVEAQGRCECCGGTTFVDQTGEPFLELHHVEWLSKGGADTIANAVALCPNCHRACHHAQDRDKNRELLYSKIARLTRTPRAE